MKVRAVALGLLLAVLSPLVVSGSPTSADGPATTTTVVGVDPVVVTQPGFVTFSASVAPISNGGTPSQYADDLGQVAFYGAGGLLPICAANVGLNGAASCSEGTGALPLGSQSIVGKYSGGGYLVSSADSESISYSPSSGMTTLTVDAPVSTTSPAPTPTSTPTPTTTPPPVVTSPTTTSQHGYWLVGSDGGIFTFGNAQFYGSTGSIHLQRPVVSITPTANDGGYWLVASDGGIFSFGDAGFYGSIPGLGLAPAGSGLPNSLNAPIVGMVPSADGNGYFMVGADGGVFTFGDAKFEGSCPGIIGGCSGAAVAVMPDASGNGYWLVTATGHVYAFGDAVNYGAPGPQSVPVTGAVRTKDGAGYWILFANGVVAPYGDAANLGGPAGAVGGLNPASAIFTTADGGGYWVAAAKGSVYTYGDAPNDGSMAGQHLNGSIIAATGW